MTTSEVTGPARVRVCAVLVHDGRLCLIRRQRSAGLQHSLPGGLVEDEDGEDPIDALRRELIEELGLDLAVLPAPPVLRFVQDQETERPGEVELFRRRHLVFTAHLPVALAQTVAETEQDDPGRAPVVWLPAADAAGLHLYPDVAAVLGQAVRPDTAAGGPVLLPAMTAASYQWRGPPERMCAETRWLSPATERDLYGWSCWDRLVDAVWSCFLSPEGHGRSCCRRSRRAARRSAGGLLLEYSTAVASVDHPLRPRPGQAARSRAVSAAESGRWPRATSS
ncbi:NUDIX domain-containing protein [Kitasatospora sp. NPDC087314]|uniref:NUDIX domain-containing protein n=1 Tax=Kitasatospora sp. NPDC087314 TaxID=3364068 RepID=UPI00381F2DE9